MMALKRISFPLIGLLFIIAISCKKEANIYPKVSILEPAPSSTYGYGDTLLLTVAFKDLDGPVLISLLDGDKTVGPGFVKVSSKGDQDIYQAVFDDPYLPGNNYTIRVIAYHGDNRSAEFQKIIYQEASLARLGFAVLLDNGGQRKLGFLSSQGNYTQTTLNGDYPFIAVNPPLGQIVTAPAISGKLGAYDTYLNLIYDVPNPGQPGAVQYHQILGDGQLVYTLEDEGFIRAYGETTTPLRNYQLDNGRIPLRGAFNRTREFLVAAAEPGFTTYKLLLLNPVNGFVLRTADLTNFPIGVASDAFGFYILCTDAGSSVIYKYSSVSGTFQEWARITGESPVDIASTQDACYIATSAGLYMVVGNPPVGAPGHLSNRLTGKSINDLCGSFNESALCFASGESIFEYQNGSVQLLDSISGNQITKLEVLYNK